MIIILSMVGRRDRNAHRKLLFYVSYSKHMERRARFQSRYKRIISMLFLLRLKGVASETKTQRRMAQPADGTASSTKLTPLDLTTIREALYDVRSKWEDIGIELVGKNETDAIKKEKANYVGDCLTEMLSIYLKRDDPEPSWDSIIAALRVRAVGESRVAQKLEQRYLSQPTSRQQNLLEPQVQYIDSEASQQNPGQVASPLSFRCLDINNLSPHERMDLIQRLSSDYRKILEKFAILQACICESLNQRTIPAERITNSALSLALYKSDDVPRPLLANEQESLEEAKTIDRVFILLRKHRLISYFDHGILKHIIETHGTEDDKRKLKDYVDEFHKFCQRKVYEVPSEISKCTLSTRKVFKVLITADMSTTLTDIKAAERKIADILGLAHSVLTLHEITPGSLVLTLSIPIQIADKIFPLQAPQLSQLKANGFTILSDEVAMDQPRKLILIACMIGVSLSHPHTYQYCKKSHVPMYGQYVVHVTQAH